MWNHDTNAITTYYDTAISTDRGGGIKDKNVWQEVEGWSAFPIGWGMGMNSNPMFDGQFAAAVKIYCYCEKHSTEGVVDKANGGQAKDACGPVASQMGNWGGPMLLYGPKTLEANKRYSFYCANNEKGGGIIFTKA